MVVSEVENFKGIQLWDRWVSWKWGFCGQAVICLAFCSMPPSCAEPSVSSQLWAQSMLWREYCKLWLFWLSLLCKHLSLSSLSVVMWNRVFWRQCWRRYCRYSYLLLSVCWCRHRWRWRVPLWPAAIPLPQWIKVLVLAFSSKILKWYCTCSYQGFTCNIAPCSKCSKLGLIMSLCGRQLRRGGRLKVEIWCVT